MVETADTTAFAVLELAPQVYRLESFGREPSRTQLLRNVI
jgi:hypothetical protein